jgi:hypothetical protein
MVKEVDMNTTFGAFYIVLIPLSVFMIIYEEMIREKMSNLRIGLLALGCSNAAFWMSWVITGIVFSTIMSVIMIISGSICGYSVFTNSPPLVLFTVFFAVSISYVSMGACLCTMMNS